ncbi:MAG: GntR family transcriptional regulator [Thermoactinomyces sp.]
MDKHKLPLYLKIKEEMIKEIKQMSVGSRIPSRTKLVKKYNVSRTTIDRVISELIGEGYLNAVDGSGTYVAETFRTADTAKESKIDSWALVIPNIMDDTYPGILRGVEDVAHNHNINLVICNTDNFTHKQSAYIDKLINSGIRGIIIVPAIIGNHSSDPFNKLIKNGIPIVFCNRGVEGVNAHRVISNNYYGGYIATKHLIRQGFNRIAYISKPLYSTSSERYQGYCSALLENSLEINDECVVFEENFKTDHPGYESALKLFSSSAPPDAVFCFNDDIARGVYHAVKELGFVIGKDVGIVGYDNTFICEELEPKLTSIKFNSYEIGKIAASVLLSLITKTNIPQNKTILLQPELVLRNSCGESQKS